MYKYLKLKHNLLNNQTQNCLYTKTSFLSYSDEVPAEDMQMAVSRK